MTKFIRNNLILIAIAILSFTAYTYKLSTLPPGLTWDEAALGYNAYSLLLTGRDEHGSLFPLIFKSFGDYKPGLYIYFTTPFVAIFGLSEFSVRLPSALFGALATVGIYLLTNLLFEVKNSKLKMGHIAAAILAASPWHLHYSRGAWEANLSLTLTVFALYFWLKFLKGKTSLYPSILLALLSLLTYQSAKMITPLLFLATLAFFFPPQPLASIKKLISNKKDLIVSASLSFFVFFFYFYTFTSSASNRLTRLSIFNFKPQITPEQLNLSFNNKILSQLFYSPKFSLAKAISSRYLYHFSPSVLFSKDAPVLLREALPITGLLHMPDFIWIILGAFFLLKFKNKAVAYTLVSWLLLSPLPAALTLREYSPTRSLFMVIPLSILIALGIYHSLKINKYLSLLLLSIYAYYIAFSLQTYFQAGPQYLSQGFNFGYKQAAEQIKQQPASQVLFTDVLGQPYIYYLFYTGYNPQAYQQQNDYTDQGIDVGKVGRIDNISFQQFAASEIKERKDTLFIGSAGNIPNDYDLTQDHIETYTSINDFKKFPIFKVIKTK